MAQGYDIYDPVHGDTHQVTIRNGMPTETPAYGAAPATRPTKRKRRGCGCAAFLVALLVVALLVAAGATQYGIVDDWLAASPIEAAEDEALASKYYAYSQLDENERECYRIILRALETREPQRYPHDRIEEYGNIFHCVMADHPELIDVNTITRTTSTAFGGSMVRSATVGGEFGHSMEYTDMVKEQADAIADECLAGMPEGDDYVKAKYLYEWLAEHATYDHTAASLPDEELLGSPSQTIEGALVNGVAVCGGYASAYQYLMQRCGLQCVRVTGVAGGESHAWCLAKLDGDYYYIDPTWADPQSTGNDVTEATDGGNLNYDYLGLRTEDLLRTHTLDTDFPLPDCTAITDNYYIREGLLFTSPDEDRLGTLAAQAQAQGGTLQVRCTDSITYRQLLDGFVASGDLGYYLPTDTYRYSHSDENCSITILPA